MKKFALAVVLTVAGSAAGADDAALMTEARKCAAIEGAGLRMTCYDAVFKGDGKAILPEAVAPSLEPAAEVVDLRAETPTAGNWQVRRDKSAMTDQDTVVLTLTSNEMVQCRQYGSPSYLTLLARCKEDTTAIFITGDCHVASGFHGYGEVTLRLDDGKPFKRSMDASTDSSALGLWDGGSAIPLLKQMIGKKQMIARFTPFGANPVEPTFDTTGFDEAVKPLREVCGW